MFALSTSYQLPKDKIDQWMREIDARRSQMIQAPGYMDAYFMVDRSTGKALSIVLFDSEQSLRSFEPKAIQIRAEIFGAIGVTNVPPFDHYEVGVEVPGRMRKAA